MLLSGPALAAVKISYIKFDPAGTDTRSKLNQEYITVKNTGRRAVRLRGWKLGDPAGHVFLFPRYRLPRGRTVTVHTGSGRNRRPHLYWGQGNYVWNNTGDVARLRTRRGKLMDTCRYSGAGSSVDCLRR